MGTKFAHVYATLTICYLEVKLYEKVTMIFGNTFGDYFTSNWKRFLDDCFITLTKSGSDLEILHSILNDLHKDISFSLQFNNQEQAFLDVLLENREGKIISITKKQIVSNTCCFTLATLGIPRSIFHII